MFVSILLLVSSAYAGTNSLPVETRGTIQLSHVNKFQTALTGDLIPRNTSGVAANESGSLGSTVYNWVRMFVTSGSWSLGDIKIHHSYNTSAPIGEGWMLCDGRVINQTNYDAEHGLGHWAKYAGASPLEGKYLPNLVGRYPVGIAATTQQGVTAIPSVGAVGNTINLSHTHAVDAHHHGMTSFSGNGAPAIYNGMEASQVLTMTTSDTNPGTNAQLSSAQSIQPDSIPVMYFMRVVQ